MRSSAAGQLEVSLFRDGVVLQRRTLEAPPRECAHLAQTIAFLVDAWLRDVPWRAEELAVPETPARPSAPPAPSRESKPAPVKPPPKAPSPPGGVGLESKDSEPQGAPAQEAAAAVAPPEAQPTPAPASAPALSFEASLAGGAFADALARRAGFHGVLGLESSYRERLRFGLQALLESAVAVALAPGRVSASSQALALVAAYSPYVGASSNLDLLGGAGVERLAARGEGFADDGAASVFQAALVAGLRFRQRLSGPVFGILVLEVRARPRRQLIGVDGLGPAVSLSPLSPSLALGLSWGSK